MTPIQIFGWGVLGSVAVEIMTLAKFYDAPIIEFPERYKRVSYYIVRVFVALTAGGLAVAYGIDKEVLAVNIGAATPLIIQAFSHGLPSHHQETSNAAMGRANKPRRTVPKVAPGEKPNT